MPLRSITESLDPEILEKLRKDQVNKEKLLTTISNIITYTVYLFILISLASTLNGHNTYHQKERMEELVQVTDLYFTVRT